MTAAKMSPPPFRLAVPLGARRAEGGCPLPALVSVPLRQQAKVQPVTREEEGT